jgi:hypothetical protein
MHHHPQPFHLFNKNKVLCELIIVLVLVNNKTKKLVDSSKVISLGTFTCFGPNPTQLKSYFFAKCFLDIGPPLPSLGIAAYKGMVKLALCPSNAHHLLVSLILN